MDTPDPDLVRRAVAGDTGAVSRVLAQIRPIVVRYSLARLGHVGAGGATAEDVAQEVCVAVLRALPRFTDQGRPFLAFVYGIAARKVADACRAASRDRTDSVAEVGTVLGMTGGAVRLAQYRALTRLRAVAGDTLTAVIR
jgi:RNA polymerase sigma-70 factor (ECF subfamily)